MCYLACIHKVIDLVNVYDNLSCAISTRLNRAGNTWKMDMNGPGKFAQTYVEGPGKSRKTTFSDLCALCTPTVEQYTVLNSFQSFVLTDSFACFPVLSADTSDSV